MGGEADVSLRTVGSAVMLVLIVIVLVSGSLLATTFLVGLEARTAVAADSALSARLMSHSALSLAVAQIEAQVAAGAAQSDGAIGPWPPHVTETEVSVAPYTVGALADECGCLYWLSVSASAGVAVSERELLIAIRAGEVSVWLRR